MRNLSILLLSVGVLGLTSCAYMGDSNKVSIPRTERASLTPLKVPPDMSVSFNTLYPLPHTNYSNVKQVNISPPDLYIKKKPDNTQA